MSVVSMKNLLEAGVHFGHQTKKWHPKMSQFIFAERNGIHIIDLQKTILSLKNVFELVKNNILQGKSILFVGTKKQAKQAIETEATRCNQYFVSNRWLGGLLTNFTTIKRSIMRLKKIEKMEIDGTFESLTKKEILKFSKEKGKLEKNLGGIKDMKDLPGVVFLIDPNKEHIALKEARKCNIPVVAIVDTNCDPTLIDFPVPGNDDAIRAINLFANIISSFVIDAENEAGISALENIKAEEQIPEVEDASDMDSELLKEEAFKKEKDEKLVKEVLKDARDEYLEEEDIDDETDEKTTEDIPETTNNSEADNAVNEKTEETKETPVNEATENKEKTIEKTENPAVKNEQTTDTEIKEENEPENPENTKETEK